jgi:biotin synthase
MSIQKTLKNGSLDKDDIVALLSATSAEDVENIREKAEGVLLENCGDEVFFRGLVEFSNVCTSDCFYCGIRKSSAKPNRYTLTKDEIVDCAKFCASEGFGSIVLQSGERQDAAFVEFVEDVVRAIKIETMSAALPQGLGITLCVGEQTRATYERFFGAGAHRYLLRIETSSPGLFSHLHPPSQTIETRIKCLETLKSIGFQVGTGVMIGLPGQTISDLADDILFFKNIDVDMIGMGPYIVHSDTPMQCHAENMLDRKAEILTLALTMIAVTRIVLKNVNIAATTALQAMDPIGREKGLLHGANVIMPQVTPVGLRRDYLLYEGKPCIDESASHCKGCLENRITSVGRRVGRNAWGDSRHFSAR